MVSMDGRAFILPTGNGTAYEIDVCRIPNKACLLGWVLHLSEKRWVTTKLLGEFVECVCRNNGWTIDRNF